MNNKITPLFFILAAFALTLFLYFPGFNGGFIFDDTANLFNLKTYHDHSGFEALINYLSSFNAGLLKRPITSLTFLLNASNWPADPYWFKVTNFIIHLINGLLLFFATRSLLTLTKVDKSIVTKVALLSTIIWLVHPFFVSTVMYIVQRMAMLVATFSLLGIILYCKARLLYEVDRKKSLIYLFGSVFVCTTLATLSKENGVLLPFMIYLIEITIVKRSAKHALSLLHRWVFFYAPMLVVILAMAYKTPEILTYYQFKNFDLVERLLSETRVISHYLYHLFKPEYFSEGVFGDGIMKSESLTEPSSTLFATMFIAILLSLSIIFSKKIPLISFAILFFFVGHLIESTYIPLDLYYEHRNYLPAIFLPLPIALFFIKLQQRKAIFVLLPIIAILFLSFNTHLKVKIWQDNTTLYLTTAKTYPESMRANTIVASMLADQGHTVAGIDLLNKSYRANRNLGILANIMTLKCLSGTLNTEDLQKFEKQITKVNFTFDLLVPFSHMITSLADNRCHPKSEGYSMGYLTTIRKQHNSTDDLSNNITFYFALLYAKYEHYQQAIQELEQIIDPDNSLPIFYRSQQIIDLLIERKEYDYALNILDQLQPILDSAIYQKDLFNHKQKAQQYRDDITKLKKQ